MPELVVISSNGGAGKTSVVASLAAMAHPVVLVDCNVSGPHLHLVVKSRRWRRFPFLNGSKARIEASHCLACGKCEELCRFQAVHFDGPANDRVPKTRRIDPIVCEGCGVCHRFCPQQAIGFLPSECGQWFVSSTSWGPMVHARLNSLADRSGQLIEQLRKKARELAARDGQSLLCDSPPGVGSPVMASLAGADLALIVTEPTRSSLQGLERLSELCWRSGIAAVVAINKGDLNESLAEQLEALAGANRLPVVGRVRYDPKVSEAQMQGESVVEYAPGTGIAGDLRHLWESLRCQLGRIRIRASLNGRKHRTTVPPGLLKSQQAN
jgi:MinD superfamily P-loop ATPase